MANWIPYADYRKGAQHTVQGTVLALPQVWSPHLQNARDVLVYLPPSYAQAPERRYPVLYLHDGQNLFDEYTAYAGEWQVDETLEALSREGLELIAVGVFNYGDQRRIEYNPFPSRFGAGKGEAYLHFLVETLKPLIDADFRTLPDRAHTGLMGSSMGGLISLYGFFSFAETFGIAGVMSPAFIISYREVLNYVAAQPFVGGRLYMDVGARELVALSRLDGIVGLGCGVTCAASGRVLRLLQAKGYRSSDHLFYVEEKGAPHHEAAWRRRLPAALRWMFGAAAPSPAATRDSAVDSR